MEEEEETLTPLLVNRWTDEKPWAGDLILGDIDLSSQCPLDNGLGARVPTESLGDLAVFPEESLHGILAELDVLTLTAFRRVNKQAMRSVDTMFEYQLVRRECPEILRQTISLEARFFSFRTLFDTLCTKECHFCGEFGGYLYTIRCLRVCRVCFTNGRHFRDALLPTPKITDRLVLEVAKENLAQLPLVRTIPGRYCGLDKSSGVFFRHRQLVWDHSKLALDQDSLGEASALGCRRILYGRRLEPFRVSRRFLVIVHAPYFEGRPKVLKRGLYCVGCSGRRDPNPMAHYQFTPDEFVEHIYTHGPVDGLLEDPPRPRHVSLKQCLPRERWTQYVLPSCVWTTQPPSPDVLANDQSQP